MEQKRKAVEQLLAGRNDVAVIMGKDDISIFCQSRMFYEEISQPFEEYGYKVYCGKKRRMS